MCHCSNSFLNVNLNIPPLPYTLSDLFDYGPTVRACSTPNATLNDDDNNTLYVSHPKTPVPKRSFSARLPPLDIWYHEQASQIFTPAKRHQQNGARSRVQVAPPYTVIHVVATSLSPPCDPLDMRPCRRDGAPRPHSRKSPNVRPCQQDGAPRPHSEAKRSRPPQYVSHLYTYSLIHARLSLVPYLCRWWAVYLRPRARTHPH
ncbi:hypothetical protein BD779DRAFT_1683261 [Infundibulicybe gibba]|nr:hypothetical protein BD779DRAFT_1683261 [Infundibulicybe gibba]